MPTALCYRYLHAQHAHGDLEEDGGALVEEEVPESQQDLHVHHAGKQGQEPVQADQGQLWNRGKAWRHAGGTDKERVIKAFV